MSEIGTSEKITNVWPVPAGRRIGKSGMREQSSQNQQQDKQKKPGKKLIEEGPGKNIDEYV
ncbi:MAG: hypothetical protein OEW97_02640 [Gammaproteobacteria bacterium]|nr:hypothetical protein [Gammaproteobacteria bacterium]